MTVKYKAFWSPGRKQVEWNTPPMDTQLAAARYLFESFAQATVCRVERCNAEGECFGFNVQWFQRHYVMAPACHLKENEADL